MKGDSEAATRNVVSFTIGCALSIASVRIAIHYFSSPYAGDLKYYGGCAIGLLGTFLASGLVLSLPLFLWRNVLGLVISRGAAVVLILAHVAAAHYHAIFARLPVKHVLARVQDRLGSELKC